MKKKSLLIICLVTVLLLSLVGACAKPAPAPAPTPAPAPAPTPAPAKVIKWRATSVYPDSPRNMYFQGAKMFVNMVDEMAGGRLKIELTGAGTIVPPFELLDAVHRRTVDGGQEWAGYFAGKDTAFSLFSVATGGPWGLLNPYDYQAWFYWGGGQELYQELLDRLGYNVKAFAMYVGHPQPTGWFKKPITSVADLKGLKFRVPGLAGDVYAELGMSIISVPGGEITAALEKGLIDGAEYSDPTSDMDLGLHDAAKYYLLRGIHQVSGHNGWLVNKDAWNELPPDLQAIVKYAADAAFWKSYTRLVAVNAKDLKSLEEKYGITVIDTPREILDALLTAWDKVAAREAAKNPFFAKVLESQRQFAELIVPYLARAYPDYMTGVQHYWRDKLPPELQDVYWRK